LMRRLIWLLISWLILLGIGWIIIHRRLIKWIPSRRSFIKWRGLMVAHKWILVRCFISITRGNPFLLITFSFIYINITLLLFRFLLWLKTWLWTFLINFRTFIFSTFIILQLYQ
jgi:hypothetical protein